MVQDVGQQGGLSKKIISIKWVC